MAVIKFKPARSPRVLDQREQNAHEHTKKAVQRSISTVARSKELIKKSKEVIAATRKRRVSG